MCKYLYIYFSKNVLFNVLFLVFLYNVLYFVISKVAKTAKTAQQGSPYCAALIAAISA